MEQLVHMGKPHLQHFNEKKKKTRAVYQFDQLQACI